MAAGASAAAAAAAAARRRMEAEEEQMTPYSGEDLNDDWEFKIVRANTGVFNSPQTFQKLVEEESQAGWVFLEKFDGSRVRFKRRRRARAKDAQRLAAGLDPYRTHYGMSPTVYGVTVMVIVLAVTFGLMGLIILLANTSTLR